MVSIVPNEAQHFVSSHEMEEWRQATEGTSVEWSYFAYSVRFKQEFIVEEAPPTPCVKENPLTELVGIQCYAGAMPLILFKDHVIENFCVVGQEKRSFSSTELEQLRTFSSKAITLLEKRVTHQANN